MWARVYFYCIVGVAALNIFLLTPGKTWLAKKVKARNPRPDLKRNESQESLQGATLGVPMDPGKEYDEMVDEIVEEVKKRRGGKPGPEGLELRKLVEETLNQKKSGDGKKAQ